jgi:uncharacterized protein
LQTAQRLPASRAPSRDGVTSAPSPSIEQWLLVAAVTALWIHQDRDWTWIGLVAPDSLAGALANAAAGLVGALLLLQSSIVPRRPETHERVRDQIRPIIEMLPVQRSDLTGFVALSITAGVCEEILFRGLLTWYLAGSLGAWGAQAAAVVIFAAAHLFLGVQGALRALVAGAAFAGLYLWSGSLVPSMLLHALLDISSGWMAYEVLRERGRSADEHVEAAGDESHASGPGQAFSAGDQLLE